MRRSGGRGSAVDDRLPGADSRINRRFWAPGRNSTRRLRAYPVTIRNARLAGPFTLDEHGFCLGRHHRHHRLGTVRRESAYAAQVARSPCA